MTADTGLCRCGHREDAHDHLRDGSDCGLCGRAACPRFRREPVDRPVLSWLRRRLARSRGWWP